MVSEGTNTGDTKVSDAIKQLRTQLEEAQQEGKNKELRFLVRTVELELSIVLKTEKTGNVEAKAWFLSASGKRSAGDETAHKVKLTLEPVGPNGNQTFVSDLGKEKG